jgi:hypothetical protein
MMVGNKVVLNQSTLKDSSVETGGNNFNFNYMKTDERELTQVQLSMN